MSCGKDHFSLLAHPGMSEAGFQKDLQTHHPGWWTPMAGFSQA
jgi:hypothetical protein